MITRRAPTLALTVATTAGLLLAATALQYAEAKPDGETAMTPVAAKQALEASVADTLLAGLSATARERHAEYAEGKTRESRFVRVCDKLQLGVQLLAYKRAGMGDLMDFVETLRSLDCGDFAPAAELHATLITALEECELE